MNNPIRGFGSLPKEERVRIARLGGLKVSQDRDHMRRISKKGVLAKRDREVLS